MRERPRGRGGWVRERLRGRAVVHLRHVSGRDGVLPTQRAVLRGHANELKSDRHLRMGREVREGKRQGLYMGLDRWAR